MTQASVIIPSYRGAQRLPRLLGALDAQTNSDWEAIVVVDGDADGSEAMLAEYGHLPLRPIVFPENRGRVAALNAGFEAARGNVLIRCDDDLAPDPNFIDNHLRHHDGERVGVVGLYRNQLQANRYAAVYGNTADNHHREWAYRLEATERWRLWAGNCSIRRDTWEATGPYDSRYRAYGWEDVDYGYRIHQHDVPIVLDQDLEVDHHAAAIDTRSRVGRAFLSGQARHLFDEIHEPGASGPLPQASSSAWNRAVISLATHLSYDRACRLAGLVDASLRVLPSPLGRKAAALTIEAASLAGYQR